jgi:hypothetical protein
MCTDLRSKLHDRHTQLRRHHDIMNVPVVGELDHSCYCCDPFSAAIKRKHNLMLSVMVLNRKRQDSGNR